VTETVPGTGELRAGESSAQATATVVRLTQDTERGDFKDLADPKWEALNAQRWWMLGVIGGLFVLLNTAVVGLICFAMRTDARLISAHLATERMVTPAVLSALIAGTVAQTGAIAYAMAKFLFPDK
jgi:hypothetical protein